MALGGASWRITFPGAVCACLVLAFHADHASGSVIIRVSAAKRREGVQLGECICIQMQSTDPRTPCGRRATTHSTLYHLCQPTLGRTSRRKVSLGSWCSPIRKTPAPRLRRRPQAAAARGPPGWRSSPGRSPSWSTAPSTSRWAGLGAGTGLGGRRSRRPARRVQGVCQQFLTPERAPRSRGNPHPSPPRRSATPRARARRRRSCTTT